MKFEIAAIRSTVSSTHMELDGMMNSGNFTASSQLTDQLESEYSLDNVFPITNEDNLKELNDKLQLDKTFRKSLVSLNLKAYLIKYLKLLVFSYK